MAAASASGGVGLSGSGGDAVVSDTTNTNPRPTPLRMPTGGSGAGVSGPHPATPGGGGSMKPPNVAPSPPSSNGVAKPMGGAPARPTAEELANRLQRIGTVAGLNSPPSPAEKKAERIYEVAFNDPVRNEAVRPCHVLYVSCGAATDWWWGDGGMRCDVMCGVASISKQSRDDIQIQRLEFSTG